MPRAASAGRPARSPSVTARAPSPGDAIAIACFFLSGAAGLIYEVCWIRRASLDFGSTTYALSTVLAVFFLGLALGSRIFGEITKRTASPLRLYALLELALAILALATLPGFDLVERVYGAAFRAYADRPLLHGLARFGLVAALLLPPTVLMGGTLPLFCRRFATSPARIARSVGFLYAVNTLGAAAGCAAAGWWLLPQLGLRGSMLVGASLSAISGFAVLRLVGPATAAAPPAAAAAPRHAGPYPPGKVAIGVFIAGFTVLGYEVVWPRYLSLLVANDVHRWTMTLTLVLCGIVLGSLLASRLFDRAIPRGAAFGVLQILFGLVVLAVSRIPPAAWDGIGNDLGVCALLLLPPATLSGALFPLAARMVARDAADAGAAVGRITWINTVGGVAGSLLVGFFALSRFGLDACIAFLTGASLVSGVLALLFLDPAGNRGIRLALAAAGVLAWLAVPRVAPTRIPADFLVRDAELLAYAEGLESNLAVVRREGRRVLEIDRWWQGQEGKTHQVMAAHLPLILHPAPRRVLVVGVGAGQTTARVLMHDVERLDAVDIEPAVYELIRPYFDSAWMDDPRVRLLREDGRNVLRHAGDRWDVISLEVGQVFRPGIAAFYTADFYERARARLAPGGLVSQFVPLPFFDTATLRSVIATFLETFPQSTLWYNTSELLLIGVNAERFDLGAARLAALATNARVRRDLEYAHWGGRAYWLNRPEVFMGGLLLGPEELARVAAGAPVFRDDRPVLEYAAHGADAHAMKELPNLALLRAHLTPLDAAPAGFPPESLAAAARIRERNLADIPAEGLLRQVAEARRRSAPELIALLDRALAQNPENLAARSLLGDAFILENRLDEARDQFALVLEQDEGRGPTHRGLAIAFHQQGLLEDAAQHYQAALAADSTDAEAHNNLGALYASQSRFGEAVPHLEAAARLRPGYRDAIANLSRVRAQIGSGAR